MSIRRLTAVVATVAVLLTPAPALATEQVTGHAGDGLWRQLNTRGQGPSERSAPAAAGIGRHVYVFGGVFDDFASGQNTFLNDLYRLDTRRLRWRPVHPSGPVPPARAFAAAASHQAYQRMYVFGGSTFNPEGTEFTAFGDLWAFDTRRSRWRQVEPINQGPSPRSGAVMWTAGNRLYVFGGIDATFATHNDLWAFGIGSRRWKQLTADGDPSAPPPRHVAQAGRTAAGGVLTLYGGEGLDPEVGFTVLPDTWQYDLATGAWHEVSPLGDIEPPRNYGVAAVIDDAVYLQGGDVPGGGAGCGAPFPQNPTEQLWRFDQAAGSWQQLQPRGDPLPALKRHAAVVVRDSMYVVSGWDFQCEDGQGPGQLWNLEVFAFHP